MTNCWGNPSSRAARIFASGWIRCREKSTDPSPTSFAASSAKPPRMPPPTNPTSLSSKPWARTATAWSKVCAPWFPRGFRSFSTPSAPIFPTRRPCMPVPTLKSCGPTRSPSMPCSDATRCARSSPTKPREPICSGSPPTRDHPTSSPGTSATVLSGASSSTYAEKPRSARPPSVP